jgi:uncharacterized protein (DUF302 family)
MMRPVIHAIWVFFLFGAYAQAEIVRYQSPHSVTETIDRLEAAIKKRGLTVVVRVDHSAAAKKVGLELRPTELIVFGSAAVGSPLMQAQQIMGLSLPLKALAWQDSSGQVWLGYDDPADLAVERGLSGDHPVLKKIADALKALTDEATAK